VPNGHDGSARTGTVEESLGYIKGVLERIPEQVETIDNRVNQFKEHQATAHAILDQDNKQLKEHAKQLSEEIKVLRSTVADLRKELSEALTALTGQIKENTKFRKIKEETKSFVKKNASALIISLITIVVSTMWTYIASFIAKALSKLFGGP